MKKAKTLAEIKVHPQVDFVSDERGNGDGIWVYLKKGYINAEMETHCIHEQTVKLCLDELNNAITLCDCEGCTNLYGSSSSKKIK